MTISRFDPRYVSPKQLKVLAIILQFRREKGYSPTIREISKRRRTNIYATVGVTNRLVRRGLLTSSDRALSRTLMPKVTFIPADLLSTGE